MILMVFDDFFGNLNLFFLFGRLLIVFKIFNLILFDFDLDLIGNLNLDLFLYNLTLRC